MPLKSSKHVGHCQIFAKYMFDHHNTSEEWKKFPLDQPSKPLELRGYLGAPDFIDIKTKTHISQQKELRKIFAENI